MIVILVRHAERLSSGSDPGLSAAGKRRAALLAKMFGDANVSLILTSRFRLYERHSGAARAQNGAHAGSDR